MKVLHTFWCSINIIFLCISVSYSAVTRPVTQEEYHSIAGKKQQDLEVVPGLSADELWEIFYTPDTLPSGVTNLTVTVEHDGRAYGSYANMPTIDNIDPIDGILLTSGWATHAIGPNNSTGDYGGNVINAPGDSNLDDLLNTPQWPTYDATYFIVEFDSDTSVHGITFDFIYGSEEYREFVGSMFNDLFGCFLDGENISFDGNGDVINVNNDFFQVSNLNGSINLQYDGFTPLLRTSDTLTEGHHVMKFAIADVSDEILTSGVFLSNFKFEFSDTGTNPVKNLIEDQKFSVKENSPPGTFVGEVQLKVAVSNINSLTVLNGVPEFDFDSNTRRITVANGADLDYEKQQVYTFKILAKGYENKVKDTATITIDILDESVGDLISDQTFYVKENSPAGTFVGEVKLNVDDSIDVSLQLIQGVPEFDFNPNSREITVANGAVLDYEQQNTYYMTLEARAKEAKDDTALITIKILDSVEIDIDSAVMYDKNGDGIGDSAHVVFKSSIDDFKPYEADMEWPDNGPSYDLSIQPAQVNGRELSLPFTPANNAGVLTTGTGNVSVFFDSSGNTFTKESTVLDGIGPLLKDTAYVVERFSPGVDTFFVTFTEEVNIDDITGESFILIKDNQEITVEVIDGVQSISGEIKITFAADLNGLTPQAGDSLKILHTGLVSDKRSNAAHKDNTPVPIAILKRPVPVRSAAYYDTDGDGIVDQARISFEKDIDNPQSMKATFTWQNSGEDGTVDGLEYYSNNDHSVLKADIKDIFGIVLRDRTSGEMTMLLEYKEISGATANHPVSDKAGPVITEATYCPTGYVSQDGQDIGFDTLVIFFSEDVNDVNSRVPLDLLAVETGDYYHFELKQLVHMKSLVIFEVENIIGTDYPIDGDSIWIDYKEKVADVKANKQEVKDNKRVRLKVKEKPFTLFIIVLGPINPEDNEIPIDILSSDINIENGILMLLDPMIDVTKEKLEKTECSMAIYDAVGNLITTCKGFDDNNTKLQMDIVKSEGKYKIAIVWSGQNENRRFVGEGAYLGRIRIHYPVGTTTVENVMIGVKK